MMRKVVVSIICPVLLAGCIFLPASPLMAQDGRVPQPEVLLGNMRKALDALGTAEFGFEFTAYGKSGELLGEESGTFVAQGEAFLLSGSVITVYCDGVTKWIYDEVNREITIFPHDSVSTDPAENPFAVLSKADPSHYTFRGDVRRVNSGDGQHAWRLTMASKDRNAAYTLIEFTVSARTFLPSGIVYESRNGDRYVLKVLSAEGLDRMPQDKFTLPASLLEDPDVYVTDMR